MIVVMGRRSTIGSALIESLVSHGQQARRLPRAGQPAVALTAAIELATGELADRDSLAGATAGIAKVFPLPGPHRDALAWHRTPSMPSRQAVARPLARSLTRR